MTEGAQGLHLPLGSLLAKPTWELESTEACL